MAGELELCFRIPSLSSVTDTEVYIYCSNAGAAETNDADTSTRTTASSIT